MIWWQGSLYSCALMVFMSPRSGGDDIIQDTLSVSRGLLLHSFYLPVSIIPVSLLLFRPLSGDFPFIAGWLTRVRKASRSHSIFGDETMCVCLCVYSDVRFFLCPRLSTPLLLIFLPETETSTGILSFRWDSQSSWTQLLALKTSSQIFLMFILLAKHKTTLACVSQPEWLRTEAPCHLMVICVFANCHGRMVLVLATCYSLLQARGQ